MKKLLVILCALVPATLAAQSSPAPTQGPTFRTGVDLIAVDVAVVDGQGRPVADLLAPDFEVKVDGQPRRVVSVQLVRADPPPPKAASDDKSDTLYSSNAFQSNGRLIAMAVDQRNIAPGDVRPVMAAAAKFLDGLSAADQVAFYVYPPPGASVDFTTDRERIRTALMKTVGNQFQRGVDAFNIGLFEASQIVEKYDQEMLDKVLMRECRRLTGEALDECTRGVIAQAEEMVRTIHNETDVSLAGLRDVLRYLGTIEGPKTLIILSQGLIIRDVGDLEETVRLASVGRITVDVLMMDAMRGDISLPGVRPTPTEDRTMRENGLADLAAYSRGALYRVLGDGQGVFNRLTTEMSAYYLLGVEEGPNDRNDKSHPIDVQVRRRGVSVRSRRAFVMPSAANAKKKPEEGLSETLRSPIGVTDLPLRITTYLSQVAGNPKVDVIVAAEVGQPGASSGDFTLGYALVDSQGRIAGNGGERVTLSPKPGAGDVPLEYVGSLRIDPGLYSLRFGVVDSAGKRGSVVRTLNAWQLDGQPFAVGDLVVGSMPASGERLRPSVEPRVAGNVLAVVDLYAKVPEGFDATSVRFEIADGPQAPTLVAVPAQIGAGRQPTSRTAAALVTSGILPPGRYVVRAQITRDGKPEGVLMRPFVLDRAPAESGVASAGTSTPPVLTFMLGEVSSFDRNVVLTKDVISSVLDSIEQRSPALKSAVAEARSARYGGAAIEALAAGDQAAAAFLKGLDWYTKGEMDQAVNQLSIAAGPRREFFPAALYLGASLAAAGRDADAAGVWQLGIGNEPRLALVYPLFADARFRSGQPQSAIDVLRPAYQRTPADDEIGRRLAAAYLMTGRVNDAMPVLDSYLARHPDDQDALFIAVVAQYAATASARTTLAEAERAKLTRYARAYKGPQRALVDKYIEALAAP